MYDEEYYVVLEVDREEEIVTADELLEKLKGVLAKGGDRVPKELQKVDSLDDRARLLRDTYCEFSLAPGELLQWYAVRLEK